MSTVANETPELQESSAATAGNQAQITAVRHRPYAVTPIDILTDERINRSDRTVLAYMLAAASRPNWKLYVAEVRRTMGLSVGGWQSCRRRLEKAGYYRAVRYHLGNGAWMWEIQVTDTDGYFGPPQPCTTKPSMAA